MEKLWPTKVWLLFGRFQFRDFWDLGFPFSGNPFSLPDPHSLSPRYLSRRPHLCRPRSPSSGHLKAQDRSQNVHLTPTFNPRQATWIESECGRRNLEPNFARNHRNCQDFRTLPATFPATSAITTYWVL
jgi:hypothetical protein